MFRDRHRPLPARQPVSIAMTQLRPEQLEQHLKRRLAPVYLLGGDEPLLLQEAGDAIRAAARAVGYATRETFSADRAFDWSDLEVASGSLSLFAERRILEVRLPTGKPGDAGAKALRRYAAQPAPDTLLLVIAGRLEGAARRSRWVQALSSAGVFVQIRPVTARQLPEWIRCRMESLGLHATPDAVALLAERTEGNLLACAQEIEKLRLLHGSGSIDARLIANSAGDSARFGVFVLIDSALDGCGARCQRILGSLRAEGVDVVAIVGALAWELRKLAAMARVRGECGGTSQVLARFKVWDSRKAVVGRALERYPLRVWLALLAWCAHIDRAAKGRADGNAWDELLQLVLRMAGTRLPVKAWPVA